MAAKIGFFEKYPNKIFVETGSCVGVGIQQALNSGFEEIYSIELSDKLFNVCSEYFKNFSNIHLIHGDSRYVLEELISKINKPITFWLDAHCSGGFTVGEALPPLFEELEIIKNHPIKTHTILIDDLQHWNWNVALSEKILTINQAYTIKLEDGELSENDIMVAKVF